MHLITPTNKTNQTNFIQHFYNGSQKIQTLQPTPSTWTIVQALGQLPSRNKTNTNEINNHQPNKVIDKLVN